MGGTDKQTPATVRILREGGLDAREFVRDSRQLPPGLAGKAVAFVGGIYAREAVRAFEAALADLRPDVAHVHELYPLISPWILPACRRAGVPVVMTCNDFRLSCPIATHYTRGAACYRCLGGHEYWCVARNCRGSLPESLAYALRNASARRFGLFDDNVDRFIAISEFQREFLVSRVGIAPERICLVHCSIALPPAPVADPAAGTYVAYAGRFAPEKGVQVMIEACRVAGLPMRFAGDAPSHPSIRPGDDARFVMTRSPAELAEFYRGARVLVAPSTWAETFGIVPAEAMSHGIPVVASRLGAFDGTVVDGQTGLLAAPGDVAEFAERITRIWNDPALARRLGAAGRERVETHFSERAHFDRHLAIYRELAGGRPPGAA